MLKKSALVVSGMLVALLLSFGPASAQATRTWVSGVGDDANPCSRTAPCKTFAGAISKTAAGGEIDCIDPGGFGTVTITKAITLDCSGTFGSILSTGTNGIVVNAGVNDVVVVRGLSVNGAGTGVNGVRFLGGAQLTIEHCVIMGVTGNGVDIAVGVTADVYITDTYITRANNGIVAVTTAAGGLIVVVDKANIVNVSTAAFQAAGGSVLGMITDSRLTSAGAGVYATASGAQIGVDTSSIVNNNTAFSVVSGATIRVSNSNIYENGTNFSIAAGGTIQSAGNNRTTPGGATAPSALPLQ